MIGILLFLSSYYTEPLEVRRVVVELNTFGTTGTDQIIFRDEGGRITDWEWGKTLNGEEIVEGLLTHKGLTVKVIRVYHTRTGFDPEQVEREPSRNQRCIWCRNPVD